MDKSRLSRLLRSTLLLLIPLLIVIPYWNAIGDLFHRWNTREEYGYGYFIPFITAFLIWQRKNRLIATDFQPSWLGVLVVFVAAVLFFLGEIATTYTLVQYSLVLALVGFALALLGWQAFKLVLGPLFLLFLVVPLPPFVLNTLSGHLQLISSEIGVWVIRLLGISVFLEGNVIDLGSYQLQVVEACSGLNYLFPLMSIAYIVAYLYRVEFWKRALLFVSSVPITVLMNSFRIGVIGWLVEQYGIEQADGFLHYFEGWVIFVACLAILLLEISLLNRIGGRRQALADIFTIDWPGPYPKDIERKSRPVTLVHFGVLGIAALIASSAWYVEVQAEVHPERIAFSQFPQQLGEWKGRDQLLEDIYLDSLKLDDYLLTDYTNALGKPVNFYVAYYESQQAGSAAHSPRSCIPGGGWQIDEVLPIAVKGVELLGEPLRVNRLVIKRGDNKQLVYYWFQQRSRIITNEYLLKWYLFVDGLLKHRTDGALVRVTTPIGPAEDWQDGDARVVSFIQEAIPQLKGFVPE